MASNSSVPSSEQVAELTRHYPNSHGLTLAERQELEDDMRQATDLFQEGEETTEQRRNRILANAMNALNIALGEGGDRE